MEEAKKISEEEVQKEFDEVQKEIGGKPKGSGPEKIDSQYQGDIDGDPDNTLPEEEIQETDREERKHQQ